MSEKEIQKETPLEEDTKTAQEQKKEEKLQKREERKQKRKASFQSRKFKGGAYATTLSVIVIVIVLFINLAAGQLDLTFDLTSQGKYSLTDETKEFLKGIQDKITIYYLGETDAEIELFQKIARQFPKYSSNITLEFKDIVENPRFASEYTDETVDYDSFLVVNETNGRSKYVGYSDMVIQEFDYSTYQSYVSEINVEGQLDAAIQYVTTEDLPKMYVVEGHGETGVSSVLKTMLSNANITYQTINTLTSEAIPEDCDLLYIYLPQSDYTQEEITLIKNYLTSGGNAVICVDYVSPSLTNFTELLSYYGISVVDGIVVEGNSNNFIGSRPNQLVPTVGTSDFTEGIRGKRFIVSSIASGLLTKEDVRDTLTLSKFLTTSDQAYSKVNTKASTMLKEEGDIDGPFYLGVLAEENYNDVTTKVVVYSGQYLFDDGSLSSSNFGNGQLLLKTINQLAGEVETISVRTTSTSEEMLSMTSAQKNRNGVLVTAVLPLIILGTGITVVIKRRR